MPDLVPRPPSLPALASEIQAEVAAAEEAWQDAVRHAIRAGELLNEAKAQVPRVEWGTGLDTNFPGSRTTATNYMRLARNSATVADLPTVRDAIAHLAAPRDSPRLPEEEEALPEDEQKLLAEYRTADPALVRAAIRQARSVSRQ